MLVTGWVDVKVLTVVKVDKLVVVMTEVRVEKIVLLSVTVTGKEVVTVFNEVKVLVLVSVVGTSWVVV